MNGNQSLTLARLKRRERGEKGRKALACLPVVGWWKTNILVPSSLLAPTHDEPGQSGVMNLMIIMNDDDQYLP